MEDDEEEDADWDDVEDDVDLTALEELDFLPFPDQHDVFRSSSLLYSDCDRNLTGDSIQLAARRAASLARCGTDVSGVAMTKLKSPFGLWLDYTGP